jgi:hypothetical protein
VEEIEALVVCEERVGAVLEEQVHNVVMAFLCGPEDGSCDGIAAFGVEVCALLDKEMAECVVVVYGCPLGNCQYVPIFFNTGNSSFYPSRDPEIEEYIHATA